MRRWGVCGVRAARSSKGEGHRVVHMVYICGQAQALTLSYPPPQHPPTHSHLRSGSGPSAWSALPNLGPLPCSHSILALSTTLKCTHTRSYHIQQSLVCSASPSALTAAVRLGPSSSKPPASFHLPQHTHTRARAQALALSVLALSTTLKCTPTRGQHTQSLARSASPSNPHSVSGLSSIL